MQKINKKLNKAKKDVVVVAVVVVVVAVVVVVVVEAADVYLSEDSPSLGSSQVIYVKSKGAQ